MEKLICIKNIEECGISIIANEESRDLFFLEHMYPIGNQIPQDENLMEMNEEIYNLYMCYCQGESL